MPIRFHFDEHVALAVADGLRARGVDVTTSQEACLLGHDDGDQLSFAVGEGRALVTHDRDFPRVHAAGVPHCGICYCHLQKYDVGGLLRALLLVNRCLTEGEIQDRLEFL